MVELALMKVLKAINSDKVKIQLGDLDRLLRLQAFLDGDGVVVTGEALAQRPPMEVAVAFDDWMNLMPDEDLEIALAELRRRQGKPAAPSTATQSPPKQGEAHDPAPNTAG